MKTLILAVVTMAALLGNAADNVIAKTLYAEARGEGKKDLEYVASVIYNRGNGKAQKCVKACLKPWQFSCWNGKSDIKVNRKSKAWAMCLDLQRQIERGTFRPCTKAKHYFANSMKRAPKWAWGKVSVLVGNHYFVEGVR